MAIVVTAVLTFLLALSAFTTYVVSRKSAVKLTPDRFFFGLLVSAVCAGVTATVVSELLIRASCQYSRCGGEGGMPRLGSDILVWLLLYGATYIAAAIVIARRQSQLSRESEE